MINVMLVDDHDLVRSGIKRILTDVGGIDVVAEADSGEQAVRQARDIKPDLILMDIQMPNLDGLEATRQIRADSMLEDIPVIALTALTMPGDREQCLNAGVSDYLGKPVSIKVLLRTIEQHLHDHKRN